MLEAALAVSWVIVDSCPSLLRGKRYILADKKHPAIGAKPMKQKILSP
jgi:hypothetical protein